jgi:hypothetical protein
MRRAAAASADEREAQRRAPGRPPRAEVAAAEAVADDVRGDAACGQQVTRLAVVACRQEHLDAPRLEGGGERHEVLHLRRVVDVDPDLHAARP